MNRRELLIASAVMAGAPQLSGQAQGQPKSQGHLQGHLRAGLVAYSFRKQLEAKSLNYERLIGYVAELGLDGLDTTVYWFPDTSDQFLTSIKRTAYKNGVSLYSIATRVRLCQPTAELQRAELETARKWIDVAEKVGASHMRVFGGSIPKGASEPQAIAWAVEVLKRAAEYAGSKGIILGVEDDGGLTTTAEPTVAIVKQADSPWAGLNLDTGNFPRNGYAQVALCIPYAVNVHFKERIAGENVPVPKEGEKPIKEKADWDRLLSMFVQGGYKGFVSIEYENTEDPDSAVPRLAADLKRGVRKYSL